MRVRISLENASKSKQGDFMRDRYTVTDGRTEKDYSAYSEQEALKEANADPYSEFIRGAGIRVIAKNGKKIDNKRF